MIVFESQKVTKSGNKDSRIELCIDKTVLKIRRKCRQNPVPTVVALDAQSVKRGSNKSGNEGNLLRR